MQHFKQFMEDYNTATMPHVKFYYYERWEMAEYERKVCWLRALFEIFKLLNFVCMYVWSVKRQEEYRKRLADDASNVRERFDDETVTDTLT